jgi:hypothetical protein
MKMAVFWVEAPCSLVHVYCRFTGTCYLHHQGGVKTAVFILAAVRTRNPNRCSSSLPTFHYSVAQIITSTVPAMQNVMAWALWYRRISNFCVVSHSGHLGLNLGRCTVYMYHGLRGFSRLFWGKCKRLAESINRISHRISVCYTISTETVTWIQKSRRCNSIHTFPPSTTVCSVEIWVMCFKLLKWFLL